MNKDHVRFLVSGIVFGFLVGYIVAYGLYEPRVKSIADPVPAAGNAGMSGGGAVGMQAGMPGGAPAGMPPGGGAPAMGGGAPGSQEMMEKVFAQVAALKDEIQKHPKDADAIVKLANFFQDAGKFDGAVEWYKKALEVRPNDVNARTDMGICLREMGKPDEALAEFRRSVGIDPKHWQSWLNIAVVSLFDKGDPATAASALGKVEELNPSYQDLPNLKEEVRKARGAP
jgi:hypothetical protein